MKRNNLKDFYEGLYLLDNRLSKSMTTESVEFIKNKEIRKIIMHSAHYSYNKHKITFGSAGVEVEDILNIAFCFGLIFNTCYNKNFQNKKHMTTSLYRFVGQKLFEYKQHTLRKMPDIAYVSSYLQDYTHERCHVDLFEEMDNVESVSEIDLQDVRSEIKAAVWRDKKTYNKIKKIAQRYKPRTVKDLSDLTDYKLRSHEYEKLAFEIIQELDNKV